MTCPSDRYGTTIPMHAHDLADVWRICDDLRVPIGEALAEAVHLGIPLLVDKLIALDAARGRRGYLEADEYDAATVVRNTPIHPMGARDHE